MCLVFFNKSKCNDQTTLSSLFHTYWCVRARRLSRLLYPAAVKVSMYLSMPMDCSHTHTDHSGTHTSGTTDTHTSEPTPDSIRVPVGL